MSFSDPLEAQLREIAWSRASRHPEPLVGVVPADPRDYEARNVERLAGCLGMLRVYTRMINILQRKVDVTVDAAMAYGATHGQIATACGVSRQAARQRWVRRSQRQEEKRVRSFADPSLDGDSDFERVGPRPRLLRSPAEPVPPVGLRPTSSAERKIRIYELAQEFGVESKVVMAKLQGMGEFVRSASSTVEAPVVRRLREAFLGQGRQPGQSQEGTERG